MSVRTSRLRAESPHEIRAAEVDEMLKNEDLERKRELSLRDSVSNWEFAQAELALELARARHGVVRSQQRIFRRGTCPRRGAAHPAAGEGAVCRLDLAHVPGGRRGRRRPATGGHAGRAGSALGGSERAGGTCRWDPSGAGGGRHRIRSSTKRLWWAALNQSWTPAQRRFVCGSWFRTRTMPSSRAFRPRLRSHSPVSRLRQAGRRPSSCTLRQRTENRECAIPDGGRSFDRSGPRARSWAGACVG